MKIRWDRLHLKRPARSFFNKGTWLSMAEAVTVAAAVLGVILISMGYDYFGLLLVMGTVIYAFLWINSPPEQAG